MFAHLVNLVYFSKIRNASRLVQMGIMSHILIMNVNNAMKVAKNVSRINKIFALPVGTKHITSVIIANVCYVTQIAMVVRDKQITARVALMESIYRWENAWNATNLAILAS